MNHAELWDEGAALSCDTPGVGMFAREVLDPAVRRLAALAAGGRALEFAIGTGRVALPLMAELAAFTLESRDEDWAGTRFSAASRQHVSVYRLTGAA